MTTRVPEAAVLLGVLLSVSLVAFQALVGGALLPTALVALVILYGFSAYAVAFDDDPASALLPDPVLAGGFLLAALLVGYGIVTGTALFGLFVGTVALVPPALYHARYGDPLNPLSPRTSLAVGALAGVAVLAVGVRQGSPTLGALTGALLLLAAVDYRERRGDPLTRTAERLAVALCLGGATLALALFLFVFPTPFTALVVAGALAVVGAFFALPGNRFRR
jgi:hypothetical protein